MNGLGEGYCFPCQFVYFGTFVVLTYLKRVSAPEFFFPPSCLRCQPTQPNKNLPSLCDLLCDFRETEAGETWRGPRPGENRNKIVLRVWRLCLTLAA